MKQTNLSRFNNSGYKPGSKVKRLLWYLINRFFFNTYFIWPAALKLFLLSLFGTRLGNNIILKPKVNIKYPWFLEIGNNVWIGEGAWIDNLGKVTIKDNVCISQDAMLLTGNHNYKKETFDLMIGEIILNEGVWVGAKSTVCPGVIMKSHSILTVGSTLTQNSEPYAIYQGNPAVKVKERIFE